MSDGVCLECNGSGIDVDGKPCGCMAKKTITIPTVIEIPKQYQGSAFSANLLPTGLNIDYGASLTELVNEVSNKKSVSKNYLICSPLNTGKTVFSYTLYSIMFRAGFKIPEIMDILEVKDLMYRGNFYDQSVQDKKELINSAKIAVFRLPLDLPNKFAETIATIVERRVRHGCTTIFTYGGSLNHLKAQDNNHVFQSLLGDGSYNSLKVIEGWYRKVEG